MKMNRKELMAWPNKVITIIGMSGVGKTTLGSHLPLETWFHYSADYRIGTRYMGEPIVDNIKKQAMQVPFLRDLIMTDSIYIASNISVQHLKPLSTFLGMIGNPELGGLSIDEFKRRQRLHHQAEVNAMNDVPEFIHKGREIYGYPHFLNDTGGSACELTNKEVWNELSKQSVIVYLRADQDMEALLIERAKKEPKPLYYDQDFLDQNVAQFMAIKDLKHSDEMDPQEYIGWVFPSLIAHRRPLYQGIADEHGYTIDAKHVMEVDSAEDVLDLIGDAMEYGKN